MNSYLKLLAAFFAINFAFIASSPAHVTEAAEPATVRIGILNVLADVALIVAVKKGYLEQEGISGVLTRFNSTSNMILPLSSGQLEVGNGGPGVGIYNGVVRGLKLKIVASSSSNPPGYGFSPLMVRTDLIKSGRFKSPRDLKGLTVAANQPGGNNYIFLTALLKKYGLTPSDINIVNLGYPEHVAAYANGKVDAGITTEPFATFAETQGSAVRFAGDDTWLPNVDVSVVLFGSDFVANHRDVAVRFMRAYVRAVRFYLSALKNGHLSGPNGDQIISMIADITGFTDRSAYAKMRAIAIEPNAKLNIPALRDGLNSFQALKLTEGPVRIEDVVDESILNEALKDVGTARVR